MYFKKQTTDKRKVKARKVKILKEWTNSMIEFTAELSAVIKASNVLNKKNRINLSKLKSIADVHNG